MGGKNQAGNQARLTLNHAVSGKDLPSQLTLKVRKKGQDTAGELSGRDFLTDLEERERAHFEKEGKPEMIAARPNKTIGAGDQAATIADTQPAAPVYDDKDDSASDDESDSDDSDDSDEEDTAELLKELEKIKKEKAEQARRQEEEQRAAHEKEQTEAIMSGNPLINATEGFQVTPSPSPPARTKKSKPPLSVHAKEPSGESIDTADPAQVKRRWDDDVVFKNQSRGAPVHKKRFVNDAIRNDFHKKFLAKYVT